MAFKVKIETIFGLSGTDYPQVVILEAVGAIWLSKAARPHDLRGQNWGQIRTREYRLPPDTDFGGCRCNLNFKGRKATASMTSEVKTEARFGLGSPNYPQIPILKAIDAIWILKAARPQPRWPRRSNPRPASDSASQFTYWAQLLRLKSASLKQYWTQKANVLLQKMEKKWEKRRKSAP